MYQYYKNVLPVSFKNFFSKRSNIHGYHTRNKSDYNFTCTRNKKAFTDRTVRTMGTKVTYLRSLFFKVCTIVMLHRALPYACCL